MPIGELANKHFFTTSISSTNTIPTQVLILLTVSLSNNTGMNLFTGSSLNNYNEVRGRSLSTNEHISRDLSMFSTKSSVAYYDRMKYNNTMVIDKEIVDASSGLSHRTKYEKALCISKMAE